MALREIQRSASARGPVSSQRKVGISGINLNHPPRVVALVAGETLQLLALETSGVPPLTAATMLLRGRLSPTRRGAARGISSVRESASLAPRKSRVRISYSPLYLNHIISGLGLRSRKA